MTKLGIGSTAATNTTHDDHAGHNHKRMARSAGNDHQFEGKVGHI